MTGRAVAVAVLAVLLSIAQAAVAAQAPQPRAGAWEASCQVYIVAVSSRGGGVLGNLTVTVRYPGEGRVYISTSPISLADTQGSARLAAFAASMLAGVDMASYDFYYDIEAESAIIGGPSAGVAMALATLYALTGTPCPRGVVATGMIQPDTSVGPVGGLKEKLEAAAEGGARVFIIPAGQEVYTYYEERVEWVGPIPVVIREPVSVNLTQLGEELGVNVTPVASLEEAYRAATGAEPPVFEGLPAEPPEPPAWILYMLESFVRSVNATVHEAASKATWEAAGREASAALEAAANATRLLGEGDTYRAALEAVEALYHAYYALYLNETLGVGSLNATPVVEDVNSTILRAWETARGAPGGIYSVEAAVKAYSKLAHAVRLYRDALGFLETEDNRTYTIPRTLFLAPDTTGLQLLARARSLAEWALFWANVSLEAPPSPEVPAERLERVASILSAEARTTAVYVQQLLEEAGGDVSLARAPLELAEMALDAGSPEEAVGYAIESIAMATAAIHDTFTLDTYATASSLLRTAAAVAAPVRGYAVQAALMDQLAASTTGVERLQAASRAVLYAWLVWELASAPAPGPGGGAAEAPTPAPANTTTTTGAAATATTPPAAGAANTTTPAPAPGAGPYAVTLAAAAGVALGGLVGFAAARASRRQGGAGG